MKRHANVAIFVPHMGCPQRCSFCNQNSISGQTAPPTPQDVKRTLEAASQNLRENMQHAQIAFFGGSFTAIDRQYMRDLLAAAQPFLGDGGFSGIRISTRPDAVSDEILTELSDCGVNAIELGAQSMSDDVLQQNLRGHTAQDVRVASRKIREHGISLGLQMMTGLYGDSDDGARYTASELAKLNPDTVRIYPALTLRGTQLAELLAQGEYTPQELDAAVPLCAELLGFFEGQGIRVIRLGLHNEEGLREQVLAGAYHPAFRELCESHLMLSRVQAQLQAEAQPPEHIHISVARGAKSKMIGQRRENMQKLEQSGCHAVVAEDDALGYLEVRVSVL